MRSWMRHLPSKRPRQFLAALLLVCLGHLLLASGQQHASAFDADVVFGSEFESERKGARLKNFPVELPLTAMPLIDAEDGFCVATSSPNANIFVSDLAHLLPWLHCLPPPTGA